MVIRPRSPMLPDLRHGDSTAMGDEIGVRRGASVRASLLARYPGVSFATQR
jgi:hypothetical protein